MFEKIRNDIKVIFERDPAARSVLEIFLCYPGFHAMRFTTSRTAVAAQHPGPRPVRLPRLPRPDRDRDPPGATIGEGSSSTTGWGGDRGDLGDRKNVTLYHA